MAGQEGRSKVAIHEDPQRLGGRCPAFDPFGGLGNLVEALWPHLKSQWIDESALFPTLEFGCLL